MLLVIFSVCEFRLYFISKFNLLDKSYFGIFILHRRWNPEKNENIISQVITKFCNFI